MRAMARASSRWLRRGPTAAAMCLALILASGASVAQTDSTPPSFEDAWTGGSGHVSTITVRFDEAVDAANATVDDFNLSGCGCTGLALEDTDDLDEQVTFRFDAERDTGLQPSLSYNVSRQSIRDLAGNPLNQSGPWQVRDAVAPVAWTAATMDSDGDGRIDGYRIDVSEPVQAAGTSNWSVEGTAVDGVQTTSSGIRLTLGAIAGTAATPDVTATAGAHDQEGLALEITSEGLDEQDGAAPVLLSVRADRPHASEFTATFSEPVQGPGGGLASSDFIYSDAGGGASDIASVDHASDTKTATLHLDQNATDGDIGADEVTPQDTVTDPVGQSALPASVPISAPAGPGSVNDLVARVVDASTMRLGWTTPDGAEGTFDVRIDTAPIDADSFGSATRVEADLTADAGQAQSVEVDGLTPGQQYWAALRIVADDGYKGPMSNVASVEMPEEGSTAPEPVRDLSTVDRSLSTGAVTLKWTAPAAADGGIIDHYDLRFSTSTLDEDSFPDANQWNTPAPTTPGTVQSVRLSGLPEDTTVHFAIRAHDTDRASALSNVVSAHIPGGHVQEGPINVSSPTHPAGVATADHSALFTWEGPDATYRYALSQDRDRGTQEGDETTDEGAVRLGVQDGRWWFHLTALTPDGPVDAKPLPVVVDTWPPDAIGDLQVGDVDDTSATLTWSAPADDGGLAAGYDIRYREGELTFGDWGDAQKVTDLPSPVEAGTGQSFVLKGLAPGKQYEVAIRAVDAAGNKGPLGKVVSFETLSQGELQEARSLSLDDIDGINRQIRVDVVRDGDQNSITWHLPEGLPAQPRGIQVWVANSPFDLAKTLYKDDPSYKSGTWVHTGEQAGPDSSYVVTVFFDTTEEGGFFRDAPQEKLASYPSTVPTSAWWTEWVWPAMGAVALLAVLWWLARRRSGRDDDDALEPDGAVPPGAAAPAWDPRGPERDPLDFVDARPRERRRDWTAVPVAVPTARADEDRRRREPRRRDARRHRDSQRRGSPASNDRAVFTAAGPLDSGDSPPSDSASRHTPRPAPWTDPEETVASDGRANGNGHAAQAGGHGHNGDTASRTVEVGVGGHASPAVEEGDHPAGGHDAGHTARAEAPWPRRGVMMDEDGTVACPACANRIEPAGNIISCSACGLEEPVAW